MLKEKVMSSLKEAMKQKDTVALETLRAIKSEILLWETKGSGTVDETAELKILQKLYKQRREAAEQFRAEDRKDLEQHERDQAKIIEKFLPEQMAEQELETALKEIISKTGATSAKDFGKVMGVASKQLSGKADGKRISEMLKKLLAQ